MIRLSYISEYKEDLDILDLANIEVVSNYNNQKNNISGILISFGKHFYQVIEGPDEEVIKLYEKISADDRHFNIQELNREVTEKRQYPEWGMKHINLNNESEAILEPVKAILSSFTKNYSRLKQSHDVIQTYTHSSFIEMLRNGNTPSNTKNQRVEKVVLFSDIVSFSKIAEQFNTDETVNMLNVFISEASKIIQENGGEIDKLIGDGFMAHFPGNMSENALKASIQINDRLEEIRNNSDKSDPLSYLQTGFGIDRGFVIEGNIGSDLKMDYTIIGDVVNTASRLQDLTRYFNKSIIVSKSVADDISQHNELESLGTHHLNGKDIEVELFAVTGEFMNSALTAKRVDDAIALYIHQMDEKKQLLSA